MKAIEKYYKTDPSRWIQDSLVDGKGGCCLTGALLRFYRGLEYLAALKRLQAVIQRTRYANVIAFNDSSATKFADVMRVVHKAQI